MASRSGGRADTSVSTARRSVTNPRWPWRIRLCALRQISRDRLRWGYRRAHQLLLDEGWEINRKRTQRLWREEGLRVPQRRCKRQRRGDSTVPGDRLRAERPDHVWALDFVRHEALQDREEVRDLFCQLVAAGW